MLSVAVQACPFCNPSSTDYVTIVDNSLAVARVEKVGDGKYKILEALKGEAKVGRVVLAGTPRAFSEEKKPILLVSTISNPKQPYWTEPVRTLSKAEYQFTKATLGAKKDGARWDLAARNLEHKSDLISESAYNLLAPAPLEQVQKRASLVGKAKLKAWAGDPTVPSERKSLYLLMLLPGLTNQDAPWLKKMLMEPPLSAYASHLPPLMIAYAETAGPEGVKAMERVFLKPNATSSATFGATSAFEFIGTNSENGKTKMAAREVMKRELDHPDRGVFAIASLAGWRDFSVAPKMEALANENKETPWVISSVVRYFRGFESAKAKSILAGLKERYPKIVESAQKPFPELKKTTQK